MIEAILVLSAFSSVIGLGLYSLEVFAYRVGMFTKWRDLSLLQITYTAMTLGGVIGFLLTLILGAIFRA
jgi:hypothetical protein